MLAVVRGDGDGDGGRQTHSYVVPGLRHDCVYVGMYVYMYVSAYLAQ